MEQIIQNNSDFLFLYEAILSNPNGDPDQENKMASYKKRKSELLLHFRSEDKTKS